MEIHYTSSIKIVLREDGIIESRPIENMRETIELKHALENIKKINEVKGDRKLMLIEIKDGKFSQESRQLFSKTNDLVSKVALLSSTAVSEVAGNFFLGFNQPAIPIKLFYKEAEAIAWLKSARID